MSATRPTSRLETWIHFVQCPVKFMYAAIQYVPTQRMQIYFVSKKKWSKRRLEIGKRKKKKRKREGERGEVRWEEGGMVEEREKKVAIQNKVWNISRGLHTGHFFPLWIMMLFKIHITFIQIIPKNTIPKDMEKTKGLRLDPRDKPLPVGTWPS